MTAGTNSPGRLNAWIDFNRDGDFDANEKIVSDLRVGDFSGNPVVERIDFTVPAWAVAGPTFARFRYGYTRNQGPTGPDIAGEVEDHRVQILGETPQAVNDVYTDLENGTRTLLVLANDIRSRYGDIRVVSVTPGSAGGTTRPAADGQAVIYTPRNASFSGSETFSYTIEDQKTPIPNRSSAIVTVTVLPGVVLPQAIDDSASFAAGSTNSSLSIDVLRNDFTGKSPPIGIVSFTQPFVGRGSVQLNDKGTAGSGG